MLKNLNLEEKIKISTRINQFILIFIATSAILVNINHFNSLNFQIAIGFIGVLGLITNEIFKKWISTTVSGPIYKAVLHTNNASSEIIEATTKQENTIGKHLSLLKTTAEVLNKLSNFSNLTKINAQKVTEKSQEILVLSGKEQEAVRANIEKMRTLKQKIEIIAELILELSEHTQQIGSIIGVVDDITEQTNMLALNAAVEAARAGEHGKGFAVVASEIRKLADESKQATTKISSLIYDIQQATNSTVMATEEGTKEIESGVDLAYQIAQSLDLLRITISEAVQAVDGIVNSANQEAIYTTEVSETINQINLGMIDSETSIKQSLATLKGIASTSKSLKDKVFGEYLYQEGSTYQKL